MDSLHEILAHKNFDEPPEVASIKQYARDVFRDEVHVQLKEREIIISTPSAAMANMLRLRMLDIQKLVGTERRLVFRTGK
jgi:hypothetical protein